MVRDSTDEVEIMGRRMSRADANALRASLQASVASLSSGLSNALSGDGGDMSESLAAVVAETNRSREIMRDMGFHFPTPDVRRSRTTPNQMEIHTQVPGVPLGSRQKRTAL
jgi:hypothetical protein